MANLADAFLGAGEAARAQRIHSQKDYVELEGIFIGLELERLEQSPLRVD